MINAARIALIAGLLLPAVTDASVVNTLSQIASAYGLNEQYAFQFPTQQLSSSAALSYVTKQWSINDHGVQFGTNDIQFVSDPASSGSNKRAPSDNTTSTDVTSGSSSSKQKHSSTSDAAAAASTSAPVAAGAASNSSSTGSTGSQVLRIEYPSGSYSSGTGGTQFTAEPLQASSNSKSPFTNMTSDGEFERMLLSYDIFFPTGFQFNQGGKLPGLRGGSDPTGCSGGHQSDGQKCFSSRLMWRTGGLGEVYAYLPPNSASFCKRQFVTCNNQYGTSIGRSTFSFIPGKWQTVWLYVELNKIGYANGQISLWYNGVRAMTLDQLEIRKTTEIASITGLYFSTFFGGDDATWATPTTQYSYYRNIQLYGGIGASNATGPRSAAAPAIPSPALSSLFFLTAGALAFGAGLL